MASQSSSVPSLAVIASKAANAAGNHGSLLRSCAVSRRVLPVTVMPTALVPGVIKASLLTFFGYRATYCAARFTPAECASKSIRGSPRCSRRASTSSTMRSQR